MEFLLNRSIMLVLLLAFVMWACHVSSRVLNEEAILQKYQQWMVLYGRAYRDNKERVLRFKIFKDNVAYIENFNSEHSAYKLSVNKFADQTKEEFIATHTGFRFPSTLRSAQKMNFRYDSVTGIPSSMDWRQKGAVTPVKAQGQCGSCWAFSTIAATEGINHIATGKLNSLSVQELMDCEKNNEDNGCEGGFPVNGFDYIIQNKGINTEAAYPYQGQGSNGTCNTIEEAVHGATISGYEIVPANNESALLNAVAMQPVSVTVDATNVRFYSSGVFSGTCDTQLNHAVTAVGYGTTDDGMKYWLVKNSWGADWGEEGYFKIQRDIEAKEGMCGIAIMASYPTV